MDAIVDDSFPTDQIARFGRFEHEHDQVLRHPSTAFWFLLADISMKSITTRPPISRNRNWRAISSAASRLVCKAVSSISPPLVARAELMSIDTNASVGSITIAPPDGRRTSRWNADSI